MNQEKLSDEQVNMLLRTPVANTPDAPILRVRADWATKTEDIYAGTERNAPCPCGSGKKYKQCHGKNA